MNGLSVGNVGAVGDLIRRQRVAMGLRQQDLALVANVGVRFVVDIESGKETCQIGRVLRLLDALGIGLTANFPAVTQAPRHQNDELGIDEDLEYPEQ